MNGVIIKAAELPSFHAACCYTTLAFQFSPNSGAVVKASFVEFGYVITCLKFSFFMTPDMAWKTMSGMASGYIKRNMRVQKSELGKWLQVWRSTGSWRQTWHQQRCQTWHRVFILLLISRCHVWHLFLTPCLALKNWRTQYLQSLAQLRQTSLHI